MFALVLGVVIIFAAKHSVIIYVYHFVAVVSNENEFDCYIHKSNFVWLEAFNRHQ